MFKLALFCIIITLSSASVVVRDDPSDLADLLNGFNDYLNIDSQADLDKCADIPLIEDINKTLFDLNATIPNPVALVKDVYDIYHDYQAIRENCPEVAEVYDKYFSNLNQSIHDDPKKVAEKVYDNLKANLTGVAEDASAAAEDIKSEQYYNAGTSLGELTAVLLAGYLPN